MMMNAGVCESGRNLQDGSVCGSEARQARSITPKPRLKRCWVVAKDV